MEPVALHSAIFVTGGMDIPAPSSPETGPEDAGLILPAGALLQDFLEI
jgi:hypothetical protein